jgi:hypothetical protein
MEEWKLRWGSTYVAQLKEELERAQRGQLGTGVVPEKRGRERDTWARNLRVLLGTRKRLIKRKEEIL